MDQKELIKQALDSLPDEVKDKAAKIRETMSQPRPVQIDLRSITIALVACAMCVGKRPTELNVHHVANKAKELGAELFGHRPISDDPNVL